MPKESSSRERYSKLRPPNAKECAQVRSPKGALFPPSSLSVALGDDLHTICTTAIYSGKGTPFTLNLKSPKVS